VFKHILITTDFSDPAKVAAREARAIADVFDAKVTLLHVTDRDDSDEVRSNADGLLEELAKEVFDGVAGLSLKVVEEDKAELAICAEAASLAVDLIVAGRHGDHSVAEQFLGSTTERVARHASCSVWVAHPDDDLFAEGRRIMACSDLSEGSVRAAEEASELATRFNSPLTLAHVYTFDAPPFAYSGKEPRKNEGMENHAKEILEELRKDKLGGREAALAVREDQSAVAGLCDIAGDTDTGLMVVGTRGRTGLARLLIGSVAERVVRHAPCSVLVARV
jgi:nucleotide-binding universal stress UspA family protein